MNTEKLISDCRVLTDNVGGAIKDDEVILYLNNGLDRIQGLIMQNHPENEDFSMEAYINLAAGQDTYPLDSLVDENGNTVLERFFNGNAISLVELNNATNVFQSINKISPRERASGFGYFIRNKYITFTSLPTSAGLKARLLGTKKFFKLDKKRGTIATITTVGSNTQLGLTSIPTDTAFTNIDKVSIVDRDGNVIVNNKRIESFSTPNLLLSGVDFSGVQAGHFVCYGEYSSTHLIMDDIYQKYLTEYAALRIFMRDSSKDLQPQSNLLLSIEDEITKTVASMGNDATLVPILNTENLIY